MAVTPLKLSLMPAPVSLNLLATWLLCMQAACCAAFRPFLILTMSRSSSTFVCRVIDAHPMARCYDAIANSAALHRTGLNMTATQLSEAMFSGSLSRDRKICGFSGFKPVQCTGSEPSFLVHGFKIPTTHTNANEIVALAEKYQVPVIHLVRYNGFRRRVSELFSEASHIWQDIDVQNGTDVNIKIDLEEMRREVKHHAELSVQWSKRLRGMRHLTLLFEEIQMKHRLMPVEQAFAHVFDFLRLDRAPVGSLYVPVVSYSAALDYASHVLNRADVERAFPCQLQSDDCEADINCPNLVQD